MLLTGESGHSWEQEVTEALRSRRVDGAVLQSSVAFDIPDLSPFAGMLVSNLPSPYAPSVQTDEVGGMNAALDHLVELGHTRIAYLCVVAPGARRLAAYVRGMQDRELEPMVKKVAGDDWTVTESFVAAREMLLEQRPTAIVCFEVQRPLDGSAEGCRMNKSRLEAFSDGVIAILITIMVLDLRTPTGSDLESLIAALPAIATYLLSFVFLGIYWNNHHHLLHATTVINGAVLWANLHLLFWLSLVPFATRWMSETDFATVPTAAYGGTLLLSAVAFTILVRVIVACQPPDSLIAAAIGRDFKGNMSLALYAVAIPLTFVNRWAAVAIFALVALWWLVPDRRIESRLKADSRQAD
jgi:uncharacterized membrane protein